MFLPERACEKIHEGAKGVELREEAHRCGPLRRPGPAPKRSQHQPNRTSNTQAGAHHTQRILILAARNLRVLQS